MLKKILLICVIAFISGFIVALLEDIGIHISSGIYTLVGYICCLIVNDIFWEGE